MAVMEERKIESVIGEGPVLLDVDFDGVAHLRLNRPQSANSLDIDLLQALHAAIMACHGDDRVRVVVLSAAGKNFCAGGDVRVFASKGDALPRYLRMATAHLQVAVGAMVRLNAPVVAAVQGFAAGGGGLGLVCASDMVVAAESSNFLAGATRVGMAPDAGLSVTLPRLVGLRKAMELLLLNPVVPAREALALGLVNRVVPDDQLETEAFALARQLAHGAPAALAAAKRLLWNGVGMESVMTEESRTVSELARMADVREGLAAVIERRAANFTGS